MLLPVLFKQALLSVQLLKDTRIICDLNGDIYVPKTGKLNCIAACQLKEAHSIIIENQCNMISLNLILRFQNMNIAYD